ncbi:protein of unknown function DUF1605 [Arthroderma uncinatum]|uniref:protein of unknown function DUF1605 n=1 Tax=Arthroderma uncinatum TaxID=74035 RepID=UPI00144AF2D7|nr:protein of unknown function DUF1605 [Arthroderma uncinatum]KAF3480278.1 protein of unknown function DUF1605 [Arthroderma uncinatum]
MDSEFDTSGSFVPSLYKPAELLPISRHRQALLYGIEKYPIVILVGETGSGKTTQLPQFLEQAGWCNDGKQIAITQPRRVAVTSVAARVAAETKCQLGQKVGYSIRFEDVTSAATRIKFVTDGLLLREALVDPLLSRYSVIMVDEAHERSISTDVLLGVLKKIRKRRPELRIVVSSATLKAEDYVNFFVGGDQATNEIDEDNDITKIITLRGKMYPVDCLYLETPAEDYIERAVKTVFDIHTSEPDGDILLFLTGRDEINTATQKISEQAALLDEKGAALLPVPLYAGLTVEQQLYAFEPAPINTRKVIVSTNVAEASVTIDGIVYVVDCGFSKLRAYDPATGIEKLTTVPISKASATQRAGRAGRTKPGKCFRLYTEQSFLSLSEETVPEIQRSNLAPIILQLKSLGIDNVVRFDYISPPPSELFVRAFQLLSSLGAIDDYAKLSKPLGIQMAELPVNPMMAKVLLSSTKFGCLGEILSIAAMTTLQDTIWSNQDEKRGISPAIRQFAVEEGDHLTYLNIYHAFVTKGKKAPKWCKDNSLVHKSMMKAISVRVQLENHLKRFGIDVSKRELSTNPVTTENIQRCLTTGFFGHAAKMQPDGTFKSITGGMTLHAHPSSLMFNRKAEWVIFNEILQTSTKTFIKDIAKIEKPWLLEMPHHHHGHGHGHGCHDEAGHDHSNDVVPAVQSLLYKQVDFDKIVTLNESEPKAGAAIVKKPWDQRLEVEPQLESDADEQLLMHIPFAGQVKLHSVLIYAEPSPSAPNTVKLFRNRPDLDFSTASDLSPTQTISVPQSLTGSQTDVLEIPLNRAVWNGTTSVTLFFEDNWSHGEEDVTRVGYIGFKGDFMALNKEPITFLYEAAANPKDHTVIQGVDGVGKTIGTGK